MFQFYKYPMIFVFLAFMLVTSFVHAKSGYEKKQPEMYVQKQLLVQLKNGDIQLIRFDQNVDLRPIMKEYSRKPEVEYVEFNSTVKAAAFPNDPQYQRQWYLSAIFAREGWSKELVEREQSKVKGSIIAVLDSGVDIDHPDLENKIWVNSDESMNGKDDDRNGYIDDREGWDFVNDSQDPHPKFGFNFSPLGVHHGTIVAGIAAAKSNNHLGITGISWESRIMPLRVLDNKGIGTVYNVIRAVKYSTENGADVINMSFVANEYSQVLYEALRDAAGKGVIIVAAAGQNQDDGNDEGKDGKLGVDMDVERKYPVCSDAVNGQNFIIGVASLDRKLQKSVFSNFGSNCIDISAPGEDIFGLQVYDTHVSGFNAHYGGPWSGTSLSAPIVSAAAAIVKSLRPNLSSQEVINIVLDSADDIGELNVEYKGKIGLGNINIKKTVENALQFSFASDAGLTQQNHIVAGLGFGSFPQVKLFDKDFNTFKEFFAYAHTFGGAVNIESIDFDGDGIEEVISAAGFGGGPHIRIFNIEGSVLNQFFAFDTIRRNGAQIAVGDINGDGKGEIVTGAGKDSFPEIKIFRPDGTFMKSFRVFGDDVTGGVSVAVADVDSDGISDVIVGSGPGSTPQVRMFGWAGNFKGEFLAFDLSQKNGIHVEASDMNNDGRAEIIVSSMRGSRPTVRVFGGNGYFLQSEFLAYAPTFRGGVNVAVGDYDEDGVKEIITGTDPGGGPHIRIFDIQGNLKDHFFAHDKGYRGGVRVGIVK